MNDQKFKTIEWAKQQPNKRVKSLIKEYTQEEFEKFEGEKAAREQEEQDGQRHNANED